MKTKQTMALGLGVLGIASVMGITAASAASDTTEPLREAHKAHHEAMHTALLANDYNAFKTAIAAMPKPPNAPEITEATFNKLVEAERLRQSGDKEGAKKIMDELGFTHPGKGGRGKRMMDNLTDVQKAALEQARPLFAAGKHDEAKALLRAAGITPPTRP